jgi:hypothetical protein
MVNTFLPPESRIRYKYTIFALVAVHISWPAWRVKEKRPPCPWRLALPFSQLRTHTISIAVCFFIFSANTISDK